MDPQDAFSATYGEARDRFLAAAHRRDAAVEHCVHPTARGSRGEELAIDAALLGDPAARAMLIVSSGVHGVEGFCGSGFQVAALRDEAWLPFDRDVAVLMVHAINPFGFSHLRRVNEDNVDLNRNFRDWREPVPINEDYARLHPHALPSRWPPPPEDDAVLFGYIARHGLAALQHVISSGQYQFPDGMFYGGDSPAWSNLQLRQLLARHARPRQRVAWIDFHSGLGSAGEVERIYAGIDGPTHLARARTWWGPGVTSFHEGTSVSAAISGAMYHAIYDEAPGVEHTGIALEFGTVPLPEVFAALRADHWRHAHPGADEPAAEDVHASMRRAFHSDAPQWQGAVLAEGRAAVAAALANLAARP